MVGSGAKLHQSQRRDGRRDALIIVLTDEECIVGVH